MHEYTYACRVYDNLVYLVGSATVVRTQPNKPSEMKRVSFIFCCVSFTVGSRCSVANEITI